MKKIPLLLFTLVALLWVAGGDLFACGRLSARRDARRSESACGLHVPAPPPVEQLTAPKQCASEDACFVEVAAVAINEDRVFANSCSGNSCSQLSACGAGGCAAGNTGAGMSRRRR